MNSITKNKNYKKLVGLHRAEFERAKVEQKNMLYSQACAAFLACTSVLVHCANITYITTVLAIIASALRCLFSWKSRRSHRNAERGRRVVLLMKGLGWSMSEKEMTNLVTSFSVSDSEGKQWEDESYFNSAGPPCLKTLATIIEESAFWSKHLYLSSSKYFFLFSLLPFSALFIILLFIPIIPSQHWLIIIAQIVSFALLFLILIDLLSKAIEYLEVSQTIRTTNGVRLQDTI